MDNTNPLGRGLDQLLGGSGSPTASDTAPTSTSASGAGDVVASAGTLGKWTPFGGVGWTNYGSSPYIKLDNGVQANAGMDYRVAGSDNVGVAYNYRQRIATRGAAQSEVTAYWAHKFNDRLRLQGQATGGMSNGSPDWGVGTSVNYAF